MYITPISTNKFNNNNAYKANTTKIENILKGANIPEQIDKLCKSTPETKSLFAGLTAVASSLIAEFALYTETNSEARNLTNSFLNEIGFDDIDDFSKGISEFFKNKKEEEEKIKLEKQFKKFFADSSKRTEFYELTSKNYQNLNKKYEQLVYDSIKEPDNKKKAQTLQLFEIILNLLTENNCKYTKGYLEALNTKYINCIDEVCTNLLSTLTNGNGPMAYLVLINNEALTEKEIKTWAKARYLGVNEYMQLKDFLDEKILINLSNLKEDKNNFKITYFKEMESEQESLNNFIFSLNFDDNLSAIEKLKIVASVHTAIYGNIFTKEDKDKSNTYVERDIQTEMLENIVKDRQLDAVYNLAMYFHPERLKEFNYTGDDVKFLLKGGTEYNKVKQACSDIFISLNLESKKIKQLTTIMNNDDLYKNLLNTRHARLRFISRFVLKEKISPDDLEQKVKEKMDILERELSQKASRTNYFCYRHEKGLAPQFYLKRSELGDFIKITLNDSGSINTLFEDYHKEYKNKYASEQLQIETEGA